MRINVLPALVAFTIFWAAIPGVRADMSIDMVRVTCLPELQYHTREQKEYTLLAEAIAHGFESFDDAARQKRLTLLESYGLYLPESKNQECRVPLQTVQAPSDTPEKNGRSVDFVRITCIPQLRYLEIETLTDPVLKTAITKNLSVEEAKKRMEKYGLFLPNNLKYTCKLPETTYELTVTQSSSSESGMCSSPPASSFSLLANGKGWFRDVSLNEDCANRPSVTSLIISDGKQYWNSRREMILCVKEKPTTDLKCNFRGLPLSTVGMIPDRIKGPARAQMEEQLEAAWTIPGFPITQENLLKEVGK